MDAKVGIFVNAKDSYHERILRETKEAAISEGVELEVFDAQRSAMKQAQDLVRFQYNNEGKQICVMVIPEADIASEGHIEKNPTFQQAQRLLEKNMGWIMLNHGREEFVSILAKRFPKVPVALVAIDNVAFGRTHGKQLRRLLPTGGTVLCVRGNPRDSACLDRSEGLRQELEGAHFSLEELDACWSDDTALTMVEKWLKSARPQTSLDAVVAQNDLMGIAAKKALIAAASALGRAELVQVPVVGGDGLPDIGRPKVDDKTLTATVVVTLPGKVALQLLVRHWRDGAALPLITRLSVSSYPVLGALSPVRS